MISCPTCGEVYESFEELADDECDNSPVKVKLLEWTPPDRESGDWCEREGVYQCDDCGQHFSTNKELGRHRATDH